MLTPNSVVWACAAAAAIAPTLLSCKETLLVLLIMRADRLSKCHSCQRPPVFTSWCGAWWDASCLATLHLTMPFPMQVLGEGQRARLNVQAQRLWTAHADYVNRARSMLETMQVLSTGQDSQLLAQELLRQQFPLYSEVSHAEIALTLASAQRSIEQ